MLRNKNALSFISQATRETLDRSEWLHHVPMNYVKEPQEVLARDGQNSYISKICVYLIIIVYAFMISVIYISMIILIEWIQFLENTIKKFIPF